MKSFLGVKNAITRLSAFLKTVSVQLPNGGVRGTREPSCGTFAFLELRRIPGEPSKDPPGESLGGSREGCSCKPRNASAPTAALPRLPSVLKARASCVFHRTTASDVSAHPFRPPNRTARTGCQPRCRRPRRRPIQLLSSGLFDALRSSAERKEATKLAASRTFGRSGAVAGRASSLDTSTGKGVKRFQAETAWRPQPGRRSLRLQSPSRSASRRRDLCVRGPRRFMRECMWRAAVHRVLRERRFPEHVPSSAGRASPRAHPQF